MEHTARQGVVFGRHLVFTYGPPPAFRFYRFDPTTYGWVITADLLMTGL
ncbi:hypothetical protein GGQ80_002363 [Sphingomonas jinjuensis]|uniref:Uncharacterized protein n=1 Tax=Sphingomonas jinjuensis TaxID=535907 RepID=A0A840F903_9SPHN|nr:hypothetical protein [Sphingomonas jinjuensis]MBB4154450.1 hypothetical protein [Sphingomonas jinjuensis]